MQMPGRSFTANNSSYRYGFNGQENSSEIEANGNSYTAEFWQYDARIGRRWNTDPKPTIGISPYAAFNNNPVFYSDPFGDTTVAGAGGGQSVGIDEKTNSLQFYSSASYKISGTNTGVPVQEGQLRSFSNALGTFSAKWSTDKNGTAVFAGYKNENNQTVEDVVKEVNSWKYKAVAWLANFGESRLREYNANPVAYNIKLTTTMLAIGAVSAVEPAPYMPGYNPSVTTQESMSALGTLQFAPARLVLNPSEIHFMQSSIKNTTGNFTVLQNALALKSGNLNPEVLRMNVWQDASGKIWTLDHRRLAAFRLSGLQEAPIQWANPNGQMWKMTTTNGGTSTWLKFGGGNGLTVR